MSARDRGTYCAFFPLAPEPQEDLFNALAAALDQDDQHNYRKDGGNYANKCYIVHVNSPFLLC